jgi:hypothetical protein
MRESASTGWWRRAERTVPPAPAASIQASDAGVAGSLVTVMLRSTIPGVKARIKGSDDVLQLPASISNARGKTVRATFFRDGFEPHTMDILLDEERAVQITLLALPSPDAAPAAVMEQSPATVEPPPRPAPSRRKKDKKATDKADEDIYRRPGMGEPAKPK